MIKFNINRENLIKPLQLVVGVVERRQTLPILSNILMAIKKDQLLLTGTDMEVEIVGRVEPNEVFQEGEITVPARKLVDICKSLPEGAVLEFSIEDNKVHLVSGRSNFTLSTLPVCDFPNTEEEEDSSIIHVTQSNMRKLIEQTAFAMAQQDVRYYLNGMLLEVENDRISAVATDGHRLAMCSVAMEAIMEEQIDTEKKQVIVPRKGILEMARLLTETNEIVKISLGGNRIRAKTNDFMFTSKLLDGKFPDYDKVIPKRGDKVLQGNRQELKQAFQRALILSNEKYHGVQLILSEGLLKVVAKNQDQEKAEEEMLLSYNGGSIEIGFNASYLLDVLSVLSGEEVKITLSDSSSSVIIEEVEKGGGINVVMPMRL